MHDGMNESHLLEKEWITSYPLHYKERKTLDRLIISKMATDWEQEGNLTDPDFEHLDHHPEDAANEQIRH